MRTLIVALLLIVIISSCESPSARVAKEVKLKVQLTEIVEPGMEFNVFRVNLFPTDSLAHFVRVPIRYRKGDILMISPSQLQ